MLLLYRVSPYDNLEFDIYIYIPLCFYFIRSHRAGKPSARHIYIPLCFYFIYAQLIFREGNPLFTFHYASTLSDSKEYLQIMGQYLHSTMLLLYQSQGVIHCTIQFHLHSTMLLLYRSFSCSLSLFVIIYIPLCFYFILERQGVFEQSRRHLHSTMLLLYP